MASQIYGNGIYAIVDRAEDADSLLSLTAEAFPVRLYVCEPFAQHAPTLTSKEFRHVRHGPMARILHVPAEVHILTGPRALWLAKQYPRVKNALVITDHNTAKEVKGNHLQLVLPDPVAIIHAVNDWYEGRGFYARSWYHRVRHEKRLERILETHRNAEQYEGKKKKE